VFQWGWAKQLLAFTLAAGVFLVRLVLVAALLAIGGNVMWHRPGWLERYVPDPDIEGARLPTTAVGPGASQQQPREV
jgi:RND superfamily putative drug exporter